MNPANDVADIVLGVLQEIYKKNNGKTGFKYSDSIEETDLVIAASYNEIQEKINYRPGIIFQRGTLREVSNISDRWWGNWTKQLWKFNVLWQGSASLGCLAREPDVATQLANQTKIFLEGYLYNFLEHGLQWLGNLVIGEETPITLPPNNATIVVPLSFQFAIQDEWQTEEHGEIFEQADFYDYETEDLLFSITES